MANKFTISTVFSAVDKVTGVTASITKAIDKMGGSAEKAGKMLNESFSALGKSLLPIGAGIAAASVAVYKLATGAQEAAGSIADTSLALGINTKTLQEYRYIAKMSGMETDDMDKALQKLTINLGKNSESTNSALSMLGLSVGQLKSANPDQILELIADGMKNITDPTQKAALTTELFGKSSVRMVNALSGGSDAIAELRKEAQAAGYVMNDTALKSGTGFGDTMDRLTLTVTGFTNRIGAKMIPALDSIANKFTEGLKPGGKFESLINSLSGALIGMVEIGAGIVSFLTDFVIFINPILPLIVGLTAGIVAYNVATKIMQVATTAAAAAQVFFNTTLAANPIGIVVAAVGLLVGAIILLIENWDTVSSTMQKVGQSFMKWILLPINLIMSAIVALLDVASNIPGIGGAFADAASGARDFQNQFNKTMTGTAGATDFGGIWNQPTDFEKRAQAAPNAFTGAASMQFAQPVPLSSQTTINKNTRSMVDINIGGAPAGTTAKQTGAPTPFVNLNMGSARR